MMNHPPERLSEVFGSFSHNPPSPTGVDNDAKKEMERQQGAVFPSELPPAPEIHPRTRMVVVPSMRIDGSEEDPPWNVPEPVLWDLLRAVPVEFIEERILDGSNGVFWCRYRNQDGELRSGLLRFDGVNRQDAYQTYGAEYVLNPGEKSLLRREQAAYEAAKACGMEDMVPPMAAREVNLVPLISDAIRERIAGRLRIPTIKVDETFGTAATLHALPLSSENFLYYWGALGFDAPSRWKRASDGFRHSIYRAIALDFLLGTADRSLCSFLYNRTSDRLVLYDFGVTFPDPAFTAERYLQLRAAGWDRRPPGPTEDPVDPAPASGVDSFHLLRFVPDKNEQECVDTFAQVAQGINAQAGGLLGRALVELGVPKPCVAGFFARVAFLQADPGTVFKRPQEFVRNVLVPMRRGYGFDEGRNQHVIEYVTSTMSLVLGRKYDFPKSLQKNIPPNTTFSL